ncbi:MAG: chromosomal replication initiator protein DnaA [Prevotella sp.]|nr:chromosomal replication initiator protein DnaA [Candidatus Prevotella equi]
MQPKDTKSLWASCQRYFRENIDAAEYERLFSHVMLETFKVASNTLVLQVPSSYISEEIENKYMDHLRTAIYNTFGKINLGWHIVVVKDPEKKLGTGVLVESAVETTAPADEELVLAPGTPSTNLPPIDSQLNTRQTFRSFIEGDSNKLARSVGLSISEHPKGTQFNPMFIFGPSGCGKTHLVNAMGNRCKELYQQKRVLYVSARVFQVQFTNATKMGKINDFIAFYQTIDMLIVDDVQEWMSAKATQEAFFHIFNHLYRNNRRIILVSDRTPVEMPGMEKRLLTRFSSGLMAEMEKPNLQLCVDILNRKIARDGLKVPQDVVQYIASTANGSVRDLEGIINSLLAYSVVYNSSIDMKLVEKVVKRAVKTDDTPLTVDDIVDRVCRQYELTPNVVKGRSRKHDVVVARQLSMYLAKKYTNMPVSRIGKLIGSRDHSTVLHSIEKVEAMLKNEPSFVKEVERIERALKIKE